MTATYFSDQESSPRPRVREEFTEAAWGGIVAFVQSLVANGAFGIDFPEECPDGQGVAGTNARMIGLALRGEVRDVEWSSSTCPSSGTG